MEPPVRNYRKIVKCFATCSACGKPKYQIYINVFDSAIRNGEIDLVQQFLDVGLDLNRQYPCHAEKSCIAIHRAVQHRQLEVVKLLIDHGADVNRKNFNNRTPLFCAVQGGCYNISKLLLEHGANIDDPDILRIGVLSGSYRIVSLLLQYNADVNARSVCGRTALHFISGQKKQRDIRLKISEQLQSIITRSLIQKGADVNASTTNGIRPLHIAALEGYPQIAELFLHNNAKVDVPIFGNKTALHYAAHNANGKVVEILLRYGADINHVNDAGKTALDMAYNGGSNNKYGLSAAENENGVVIRRLHSSSRRHSSLQTDDADRDRTAVIIERHIIKLLAAGLDVCENILDTFKNRVNMKNFRAECESEFKIMKKTEIIHRITAYDLVTKNLNQLAVKTRNYDILQALECYNYCAHFPLYEIIIRGRVKRAIERSQYLTTGYEALNELISHSETLPQLPTICIENIVGYLSNGDIDFIAHTFSQCE